MFVEETDRNLFQAMAYRTDREEQRAIKIASRVFKGEPTPIPPAFRRAFIEACALTYAGILHPTTIPKTNFEIEQMIPGYLDQERMDEIIKEACKEPNSQYDPKILHQMAVASNPYFVPNLPTIMFLNTKGLESMVLEAKHMVSDTNISPHHMFMDDDMFVSLVTLAQQPEDFARAVLEVCDFYTLDRFAWHSLYKNNSDEIAPEDEGKLTAYQQEILPALIDQRTAAKVVAADTLYRFWGAQSFGYLTEDSQDRIHLLGQNDGFTIGSAMPGVFAQTRFKKV